MARQKNRYTASKVRSGRPGWSVSFRHPLRRDNRGRPGLKVRRGLGTSDDQDADRLIAQLQEMIDDASWHHVEQREAAAKKFEETVVSAFFDGIEVGPENSEQLRGARILLPTRKDGYSRIMFVGTTGAGKTTLLRHIIGSDHVRDRFPSTSTARTTIADTEIVIAPGAYEAVVTFTPEHIVRGLIDECVESACLAALAGQSDHKIAEALLSHHEQRFRLSYLLGEWRLRHEDEDEDAAFEFSDAASRQEAKLDDSEVVDRGHARANELRLASILDRIKKLANVGELGVQAKLGPLSSEDSSEGKAAWLELFSEAILDQEAFAHISLDIKDDVEERFEHLSDGQLDRAATGWPTSWYFSTENRDAFLKQVRWFTSNHSQQFGRLLTPLVNGLRIRGPFEPEIPELGGQRRLVLLDGQGLGHVAEVSPSISTHVTHRFPDVDLILLVDSAQQPMQAAPITLLKAVASGGHGDRLAIAFTHFDQVKGDNLRSFSQKRSHVLASVRNALTSLKQRVPAGLVDILEQSLGSRCFLLGGLDRAVSELPSGVLQQFNALLSMMENPADVEEVADAAPVYAINGLELAIRDSVEGFMKPWEARLGLTYRDGIRKEHWTRVKALSRRFAMAWSNEYDNLRPVADLVAQLQEQISQWLDEPIGWTRDPKDAEQREAALDQIRRAVFREIHRLAEHRLADKKQRLEWRDAYSYRYRGSALHRAEKVREIYDTGAPQISSAMPRPAREFLNEVVKIVTNAVTESGGQMPHEIDKRAYQRPSG